MAAGQRRTDPGIWDRLWYQELSPLHKLLWRYLLDTCDWAGIWEPNFRLASFRIGEPVAEADMAVFGAERLVKLANGRWLLRKFVRFQQGQLNPNNKAHKCIFDSLAHNNVTLDLIQQSPFEAPCLGHGEGLPEGLAKPPCNVTSCNSNVIVEEGGAGGTDQPEAWTAAAIVADLPAIRPEFVALRSRAFAIGNALQGHPPAALHRAYADFRADMANAIKPPDNPIKLLQGYLRNAATARQSGQTATKKPMDAALRNLIEA